MFTRVLALLPLALLASASHLEARDGCSSGTIQCCNSLQSQTQAADLLQKNGIAAAAVPVGALVGVGCTPISALAIAGQSCTAQTACCSNNEFNGVVNVACTPIHVSP